MTASQRQTLAAEAITKHSLSERQACRLLGIGRTGYRYVPKRPDDGELIARLLDLAERKPRWGLGKLVVILLKEGQRTNAYRVRARFPEDALPQISGH